MNIMTGVISPTAVNVDDAKNIYDIIIDSSQAWTRVNFSWSTTPLPTTPGPSVSSIPAATVVGLNMFDPSVRP